MDIFITGAGGFLGKYIIKRLKKNNQYTIYATSLYATDLEEFVNDIIFVPNEEVLAFDFAGIDIVINCAFPRAADGAGYANGLDFLNNLFKKIQPYRTCGIIDISSQSVYSFQRTEPASEETPLVLGAVYDVAKYCMEMLIDARCAGHKIIHLRLASLIGPKFNQRIINRFSYKVIAGENITVNGGNQLFGFLDVRDCADAIGTVVDKWDSVSTTPQVFNVGAEDSNSLKAIAEIAIRIGKEFGFTKSDLTTVESDEWKNTSLNADKFYKYFKWKPQYKLEDTTRTIFEDALSE